jgi:hypothetical protein
MLAHGRSGCPSEKYGNQNKALTKEAFFFEKKNQKTFAR